LYLSAHCQAPGAYAGSASAPGAGHRPAVAGPSASRRAAVSSQRGVLRPPHAERSDGIAVAQRGGRPVACPEVTTYVDRFESLASGREAEVATAAAVGP
jgi:hypothetical protein